MRYYFTLMAFFTYTLYKEQVQKKTIEHIQIEMVKLNNKISLKK